MDFSENLIEIKEKMKHITTLIPPRNNNSKKRRALFLDRDGVIIEDRHYLFEPEKVVLTKSCIQLLKEAYLNHWLIFIITNQSGISRKLFNWKDYEAVNKKMLSLINNDNLISAIYANGYSPESEKQDWRKPNKNMITYASQEYNVDLSKSILIGDRESDIIAGVRAGVKTVFHVLTGHGKKERKQISDNTKKAENESSHTYQIEKKRSEIILLKDLSEFPKERFLNQN